MTILSDDLVEKAMRAASASVGEKPYKFDKFKKEHPSQYQEMAKVFRAALEAALPGIVEECAKVAEGKLLPGSTQYRGDGASDWSVTSVYGQGRGDAATAIRNLSTSTKGMEMGEPWDIQYAMDRLKAERISGLKEGRDLVRELANQYREDGHYGKEAILKTGIAVLAARIKQLEDQNG